MMNMDCFSFIIIISSLHLVYLETDLHYEPVFHEIETHFEDILFSGHGFEIKVPPDPVVSSCKAFIDAFSDAAANYTQCALSNSRPLRVCENCVEQYVVANHLYNVIMHSDTRNDKSELCRDIILNSDRIRVVIRLGTFVEELWRDCFCKTCYDDYHYDNGSVVFKVNEKTEKFINLYEATQDCLKPYIHRENTTVTYNKTACSTCSVSYRELNKLYQSWEHDLDHQLCMDLVDMINTTRLEWSSDSVGFGCHKCPGPTLPLIIVSTVLGLIPIIFYVLIWVCSDRQYSHILRQHRLRITRRSTLSSPQTSRQNSITQSNSPTHAAIVPQTVTSNGEASA